MNFYKVTVIIPVFNAEKELKKALSSLTNQTLGFENIEVIIVDDKSNDNTRRVIGEYMEKYSNVVGVFLDENSGLPGKPRNIGIEYASADYISFLDADDEYLENALELLYKTIEEEGSDFVVGSYYINFGFDKLEVSLLSSEDNKINLNPLSNQETFDKLSFNRFVAPWSKIFNKNLIVDNDIEFPYDSLCEDTYFYFKALINSKKVTVLPNDFVYNYNALENKNTAIHGHNLKKFNQFLSGIYKELDLLSDISLSPHVTISENIASLLLIFSNLNSHDKKEVINDIYLLENKLSFKVELNKEVAILNNLILSKRFTLAIFLSNIYKILYNNKFIKKLYRESNNNV